MPRNMSVQVKGTATPDEAQFSAVALQHRPRYGLRRVSAVVDYAAGKLEPTSHGLRRPCGKHNCRLVVFTQPAHGKPVDPKTRKRQRDAPIGKETVGYANLSSDFHGGAGSALRIRVFLRNRLRKNHRKLFEDEDVHPPECQDSVLPLLQTARLAAHKFHAI